MYPPFIAFLALLASSLLDRLAPWQGWLSLQLALAGVALMFCAIGLPDNERGHLRRAVQVPFFALVVPGLWIIIQLLPIASLAHPVWDSARDAIEIPISGHISVDLHATERSLTSLSLAGATLLLGAAVTIDRRHAELCLLTLTVCTALSSAADLFGLEPRTSGAFSAWNSSRSDVAVFGCLLALASGLLAFERFETRRIRQKGAIARMLVLETACVAALFLCMASLVQTSDMHLLFATLTAVIIFAFIVAVRRLGLGALTASGLALLLIGAGVLFADVPDHSGDSLLLAYASAPDPLIETARRMIQDSSFTGTGAGSFAALEGQYRGIKDGPSLTGPSLAVTLVIELGRPMLWVLLAAALANLVFLFRGGLTRGRDSSYAIVGAASMVALIITAFINAGVASPTMVVLSSGLFGLAMTQSIKRRMA